MSAVIQTANPSASIQLGGIGTVNLSNLLASPFRTWISGPEMVEAHYRSAVGSDPTLVVWFYVRLYKSGQMWVRVVVENGYVDVATADKSYVPTVISGSASGAPTGIINGQYYYDYKWTGSKASGTYFAVIHGKAADGTIVRARVRFAVVQ